MWRGYTVSRNARPVRTRAARAGGSSRSSTSASNRSGRAQSQGLTLQGRCVISCKRGVHLFLRVGSAGVHLFLGGSERRGRTERVGGCKGAGRRQQDGGEARAPERRVRVVRASGLCMCERVVGRVWELRRDHEGVYRGPAWSKSSSKQTGRLASSRASLRALPLRVVADDMARWWRRGCSTESRQIRAWVWIGSGALCAGGSGVGGLSERPNVSNLKSKASRGSPWHTEKLNPGCTRLLHRLNLTY